MEEKFANGIVVNYEKMDCENVSALKCKVCKVQDIRNDQNVCILCFRS